jgi:hypothetical protein
MKKCKICHALKLNMPTTQLEAILGSSLNTMRKIWNSLSADVVKLGHPPFLKTALSDGFLPDYGQPKYHKKIRRTCMMEISSRTYIMSCFRLFLSLFFAIFGYPKNGLYSETSLIGLPKRGPIIRGSN